MFEIGLYQLSFEKKTKNMKKQVINRLLDGAIVMTLLAVLTQTASARIDSVPDATTTSALFGVACFGLAVVRRCLR